MAEWRDTIPITCRVDGQAHDVTDGNVATGRRTGQFPALCGYVVMAAPIGQPCPRCTAIMIARRSASAVTGVRRSRHRYRRYRKGGDWWGWIARMW
ncbi:MAG: hypothetical protein ACRDRP_18490 [Pseudonocardiaceae bacterium]